MTARRLEKGESINDHRTHGSLQVQFIEETVGPLARGVKIEEDWDRETFDAYLKGLGDQVWEAFSTRKESQ